MKRVRENRKNRRVRRKTNFRGSRRQSSVPRGISANSPILYKRSYMGNAINLNIATTSGFWNYNVFNPTSLPNWSELQNLFDQYKICAWKVTYYPQWTQNSAQLGPGTAPALYATYLVDPETGLTPSGTWTKANLSQIYEDRRARTVRCTKPFSVYVRPKMLTQETGMGGAGHAYNTFVKTNLTSFPDSRGFHMFLWDPNFTGTSSTVLETRITVYMKLKNWR